MQTEADTMAVTTAVSSLFIYESHPDNPVY